MAEPTSDRGALRRYLAGQFGSPDTFEVRPMEGGNANETLLIRWDGRALVLRRPPVIEPAPGILHNPRREYDILTTLAETWVPVPEPVLLCTDASIVGDPFYLMERVEGVVLDSDPPDRFRTPGARRTVGTEAVDTLAKIHHVDPDRTGLDDLGVTTPADQVAQFTAQLEWAQDRTADQRELPVCFEVADWLADNAPDLNGRTLVHGDYKPDNLLFGPDTRPRIEAVLDWEMASLGDPLSDLGWLLSLWADQRDPSPITDDIREQYGDHAQFPVVEGFVHDYSGYMTHPEYPDRRTLVARYERHTGREYTNDRFYRALGTFKLATLCEGFYRVFLEDAPNVKDSYPAMEVIVPTLARKARAIIDGEWPL